MKRAQKVITQARKAIFGEIKPEEIKGLSINWKTRLQRPDGSQDVGGLSYDLLLPNKLIGKQMLDLAGNSGQVVRQKLLNGEQTWADLYVSNSAIPVMRADRRQAASGGSEQTKQIEALRKEQALLLLQLMLAPSPDFPLIFAYVGETKASDGQADVIDVKGTQDFSVRLFIDKITGRLLMMTFQERTFQLRTSAREIRAGKEVLSKGNSATIEVKMRLTNHKPINDVVLPHLVTYESEGKVTKEYELKGFKLNPIFEAAHFEPGKKKK